MSRNIRFTPNGHQFSLLKNCHRQLPRVHIIHVVATCCNSKTLCLVCKPPGLYSLSFESALSCTELNKALATGELMNITQSFLRKRWITWFIKLNWTKGLTLGVFVKQHQCVSLASRKGVVRRLDEAQTSSSDMRAVSSVKLHNRLRITRE